MHMRMASDLTKTYTALVTILVSSSIGFSQSTLVFDGTITDFNARGFFGGSGAPLGSAFTLELVFDPDFGPSTPINANQALFEPTDWAVSLVVGNDFVTQAFVGSMTVFVINDQDIGTGVLRDSISFNWGNDGLSNLYDTLAPGGGQSLILYDNSAEMFSDLSLPNNLVISNIDASGMVLRWDGGSYLTGQVSSIVNSTAVPEPSSAASLLGLIAMGFVSLRRPSRNNQR
ncbi:MAG: hypothetical protein SynsKO_00900 [Synoicihabitans sp.]